MATAGAFVCFKPATIKGGEFFICDGEKVFRDMDTEVLQQKFASNLFDAPLVSVDGVRDKLDTAAHRSLAREAAEQGVVLLRNVNGTLPLATTDANRNDGGSGGTSVPSHTIMT